jgi:beta-glucosidase-like glycosyl hydrolase/CubicO group peptidase (beta-lactamase class C family)
MITFARFISADRIEEKVLRLTDRKVDPEFLQSPSEWVDSIMDTLSIEQKIAQLIMVSAYSNNNKNNENEVARLIKDFQIGGLVFFQGAPYKQALLTNYYQSIARTPLFIGMDAENGLAMRLDSTIRYPSQMMLGAIEDDRLIFDMGGQIAKQLKRLGVHINFAPVVDVNNNPFNPVINRRSFGEDLVTVSRKSLFYMIGLENGGIISVAKHFPGHGDTESDSHRVLPEMSHSRERLDSLELFPFRELIYNGLSGIMTAHLHVPALDSREYIPSSLSEYVIDTLLRKEMGFKGLVFTDALGMKAVTSHYKPVEAAEMALMAGNDVLLMPEEIPDVIKELAKQVKNGKISQEIIDSKCRKVLTAKYWAGLNNYHPVDLCQLNADLNKPEYEMLQRKLTELSLTLLQNNNNILPLGRLDSLKVASVVFSNVRDTVFQQTLCMYMPMACFYIKGDGYDNVDSIFRELRKYNLIIASVHATTINPSDQYGINDYLIGLLDSLTANRNVIIDLFTNPYVISRLKKTERIKALLVSYENSELVQQLSAEALFGAIGTNGTLPVSSLNWHAVKSGIKVKENGRLGFSIPAEVSMSEDTLRKIDGIIQKAIEYQAMPGCQVLVARKGRIILNRTYGTQTYNSQRPVYTTDLYDLASITKVAATTQAIMHLVDEECIGINQKLSAYLPYLEQSNKKNLHISDILLHQAGLQPFIQFYYSTREPVFKNQALVASSMSDANPLKVGATQYMNRFTNFRENIVSSGQSAEFPYQVADNIFINRSWPDTMYHGIAVSSLREKKEYLYSDLGFILFKQMIDSLTHVPFDHYVDSVFYRRLGAGRLLFNPLRTYSRNEIAPTEDDQLFRHQLIRGYVHDQRAAMFGGVAGHAGLFGNAMDLAKLFQMLLNEGEYGGERYISKKTVEMFTHDRYGIQGNRRGLGFDKPEPDVTKPSPACMAASSSSFGHTGFTGTMVWVDPEYDLVFIFLSNRVYPDASNNKLIEMNVRTEVQQVVYNSIMDR